MKMRLKFLLCSLSLVVIFLGGFAQNTPEAFCFNFFRNSME